MPDEVEDDDEEQAVAQRTVLITGASSGIGEACARAFAAAGDRLILSARRRERLEALAEELDVPVHVVPLDVRDRAAVERAFGALPPAWAAVDVLVGNAGLAAGFGPLQESDPDDWDRMLDTNVRGLLATLRAVVPGMVARGRGDVIAIGSIAGHETYPNGAVYCASKAAVDRLVAGLRMDVLGRGLRVSSVDPGLVETEFSVVRFDGDAQRAAQVYEGMDPLRAEDVAAVVRWIADQPPHVQVAQVLLLPTAQASATRVARRAPAGP